MAQTETIGVTQSEKRKCIPIKKVPKLAKNLKYEILIKSSDRLKKLKTK